MAIQDIYPTALRLLGRPVLVVGAGPVAARRTKGLLDAGARVTVVAPVACPALAELAAAGLLNWEPRPYRPSDVDGVWFVQTATGDAAVDAQVSADAMPESFRLTTKGREFDCARLVPIGNCPGWTNSR